MATHVGVLGLGKMGLPMARHLLDAGYAVHGFDVRPESVEAAAAHGVTVEKAPADVARNVSATFVVVGFDDEVLGACLGPGGVHEGAAAGDVVFLCSTIAPDTSIQVGAALAAQGVKVADATLCRAEHAAVDGTLLVLCGGEPEVFTDWDAALRSFATDVRLLGALGAGQVGKMLNNLLLWINVVANAEALRLGKRLGVSQEELIPALMLGSGANWALGTWHKPRPMPWAEKDLMICMDYADRVGLPAPLSGLTREAMKKLKQDKAVTTENGAEASMQAMVDAWEPTLGGTQQQ
ncbi:NAD(P)-dependent oxidoreductase [Jiangella ureilytica]|uniref:NAD(P)-dependent oxidoreductase n=1 Tax=Jiangella ureilytica TaxID=2530374 RepID=A0A4R4RE03_9ACTN|nr:NAD(P)-dependent oxidoreductase [Jiangella ureilytica]TDC47548.1 NAD(P)-dependent oxidoreductase [Jiangella ureilytica]